MKHEKFKPQQAPPVQEPSQSGLLPVGHGHVVHWEQRGSSQSDAVLVLHGGPGSRHSAALSAMVDSARFRVVGFDQRGCGGSTPQAGLRYNTTWDLVADIEALRRALDIERWWVVGGSWGATLALAYAGRHPAAVAGLLLRGLWVPSAAELHWFFQDARCVAPSAWDALAALAPQGRRDALLPWLLEVFAREEPDLQSRVALGWAAWEQALEGQFQPVAQDADVALRRCRIQAHYLRHGCWLDLSTSWDTWLRPAAMQGLPIRILHGGRDNVCRIAAARSVHDRLPGSLFVEVKDAGHMPFHPDMARQFASTLADMADGMDLRQRNR